MRVMSKRNFKKLIPLLLGFQFDTASFAPDDPEFESHAIPAFHPSKLLMDPLFYLQKPRDGRAPLSETDSLSGRVRSTTLKASGPDDRGPHKGPMVMDAMG